MPAALLHGPHPVWSPRAHFIETAKKAKADETGEVPASI